MYSRRNRRLLNVLLTIVLMLSGVNVASADIINVRVEVEVTDQFGVGFQDCSQSTINNGEMGALPLETRRILNLKKECKYEVVGKIDTQIRDFLNIEASLYCGVDGRTNFKVDNTCIFLKKQIKIQESQTKFLVPSISQYQIQVKFSDGTPAGNLPIGNRKALGETGSCDFAVMGCRYLPVFHSSNFQRDYFGALSFKTDRDGIFSVNLPNTFAKNESILFDVGGLIVSSNSKDTTFELTLNTLKSGMVVNFSLPPSDGYKELLREEAKTPDCEEIGKDKLIQIPSCQTFTKLTKPGATVAIGNDPVPYQENTAGAVFAITGFQSGGTWMTTSKTPTVCTNPKFLELPNPSDPKIAHFSFETKSKGMCKIDVIYELNGASESLVVQTPIESWNLPVSSYTVKGAISKGVVSVGAVLNSPSPTFYYPGSSYDLKQVAPTYLKIESPSTCRFQTEIEIKSIGVGDCVLSLNWPAFQFGSRNFRTGNFKFTFFKSEVPLTAAEKSRQKSEAEARAKVEAQARSRDNKLCPSKLQNALKNSYAPLIASNKRAFEIREKLSRVNYLESQVGNKGSIQLPPNEYSSLLSGYPVLANSRQVPFFVYKAILQGSLLGEKKNYQLAFASANLAYSKATAGCKQVVGKP